MQFRLAFIIVAIVCFGLASLPGARDYPMVPIGLAFLAAGHL